MRGNSSFVWLAMALAFILSACGNQNGDQEDGASEAPEVGFITVKTTTANLTRTLPGRTNSYRTAEVRPQVNGIVEERLFKEGEMVKKGQALYRIDKRTYAAQRDTAKAEIERAEAQLEMQKLRKERMTKLKAKNAVSQQEFDEAEAQTAELEAQLAAAKASLLNAEINLDYTTVKAPIDGQIGRSTVTEGALVTANQPESLATIRQLDPIYVDMTQSASKLRQLRKAIKEGQIDSSSNEVSLFFEDSSEYGEKGELQFAEVAVSESTGSVTLRALMPNPDGELLPGMYLNATVPEGEIKDAVLIPQKALQRDPRGNASVMLLNDDDEVEPTSVVTDRTIGNSWLIKEGLSEGDRLIVDGLQKIRPGAPTSPVKLDEDEAFSDDDAEDQAAEQKDASDEAEDN